MSPKRKLDVSGLVRRSPSAHRILDRADSIKQRLRKHKRKVWPFATVARMFGISPSLLRKWVEKGVVARYRAPSKYHRTGITPQTIKKFLRDLTEEALWGLELDRDRLRPAEEKCMTAFRQLKAGEALAPAEFAARAGVGATTVIRLLAAKRLHAWYPTAHRPKICSWAEKERRIRLTRKTAKKRR